MVDHDLRDALHLTERMCLDYRGRLLPREALLRLDRHLKSCAACRRLLQASTPAPRLPSLIEKLQEPLHLSYDEMIGVIEGSAAAQADAAERHLLLCGRCRTEVEELRRFDTHLQVELSALEAARTLPAETWLHRLKAALVELLSSPPRLRLATLGVCLLVLGTAATLQVQIRGDAAEPLNDSAAHVVRLVASPHAGLVAGGVAVAVVGVLALARAIWKRR